MLTKYQLLCNNRKRFEEIHTGAVLNQNKQKHRQQRITIIEKPRFKHDK